MNKPKEEKKQPETQITALKVFVPKEEEEENDEKRMCYECVYTQCVLERLLFHTLCYSMKNWTEKAPECSMH